MLKGTYSKQILRDARFLSAVRGRLSRAPPISPTLGAMMDQNDTAGPVFRCGFGQSPFPPIGPLSNALRKHTDAAHYVDPAGDADLRAGVAGALAESRGVPFAPENIVVGNGTKPLMFNLQLALRSRLLLPRGSWVSYAAQANILDLPVHWIEGAAPDWRLTAQQLEEACLRQPDKPFRRLLIVNTPNNPTGQVLGAGEIGDIADVAREHKLICLSDEIYSGVLTPPVASLAAAYPEGTILSTGMSKAYGVGGWRAGFFGFPEGSELDWLRDQLVHLASETYSSVTAPVQLASRDLFALSSAKRERMVERVAQQDALLHALGTEVGRLWGETGTITAAPHQGGFYLLPHFPHLRSRFATSAELAEALRAATGVIAVPGEAFGITDHLCLRFAFVDFDGAAALTALQRGCALDSNFMYNFCPRVLEAAMRVAAFACTHAAEK